MSGKVSATPGWVNMREVELGRVMLPEGELTVRLQPTSLSGSQVMQFSRIILKPK